MSWAARKKAMNKFFINETGQGPMDLMARLIFFPGRFCFLSNVTHNFCSTFSGVRQNWIFLSKMKKKENCVVCAFSNVSKIFLNQSKVLTCQNILLSPKLSQSSLLFEVAFGFTRAGVISGWVFVLHTFATSYFYSQIWIKKCDKLKQHEISVCWIFTSFFEVFDIGILWIWSFWKTLSIWMLMEIRWSSFWDSWNSLTFCDIFSNQKKNRFERGYL